MIVSLTPVNAFASDGVEAVIGYENKVGKQLIMEKSSEIDYEFTRIPAIAVTINRNALAGLYESSNITYIEENTAVELSTNTETITEVPDANTLKEMEQWNIISTGIDSAWEEGFTGKNVNVAIIDTGISPHTDLTISGGTSTVDYTEEWLDDSGHGTHVAGIIGSKRNDFGIVGVAPDVNLYAVKALDANGEGTLTDLLEAIEWSMNNNMNIINLSLDTDTSSESMQNLLKKAYDSGILIVGVSGNNGNSVTYPAKYDSVIGVSAVDGRLNIAGFSSTGPEVEFSAPGINIISTYLNDSYGTSSGTSQASPHIAGMLAILKQKYPGMTSSELRAELIYHVQDLGSAGRDTLYGHGFITYKPDDQTAPGEVTNLQLTESSPDSLLVSWENPTDEDFSEVSLYVNDSYVTALTSDNEAIYRAEELEADTEYTFSLYTEDRFGNVSEGTFLKARTAVDEPVLDEEEVVVEQGKTNDKSIADENSIQVPNTSEKKESKRAVTESEADTVVDSDVKEQGNIDAEDQKPEQTEKKSDDRMLEEDKSREDTNKTSAEKSAGVGKRETASEVNTDKINASLNLNEKKEEGSKSGKTVEKLEEENKEESVDDEDEVEDESKNIFTRIFQSIGNILTTILDWIRGLF
ncbi:S8 family serine peptidase [Oceanobacillus rekensis]|uniref:S8 family serine peptidase n=1 Tax=Oceanobacillus rekensis TaxID=937927 RepID=UPI00111CB8C5|nr:S8 family serine peptidase [Oceanobacillus rekensis]